jgi:hypothetical protein
MSANASDELIQRKFRCFDHGGHRTPAFLRT